MKHRALYELPGGVLLCPNCAYKLQSMQSTTIRNIERQLNALDRDVEMILMIND
jgi:hypothetical protein